MSNDDILLVGKQVKDMYGTSIGRVLGRVTDIDGSIQSVGIDGGSQGLLQIPFEQLVIQDNIVIYIPKWRLESQRLLKEKESTLRRLKALIDIVSDNDEMKEDAEIIREKYKEKLSTLKETENKIKAKLEARLEELNEQMKSVKMLEFDAKVQYRSNEVSEQTFDSVRTLTAELVEHITHETTEISNVQRRIADLNLEVQNVVEPPQKQLQESASIYLDAQGTGTSLCTVLPEAPKFEPISESTPEPEPESEIAQPTPEPESEIAQPTPNQKLHNQLQNQNQKLHNQLQNQNQKLHNQLQNQNQKLHNQLQNQNLNQNQSHKLHSHFQNLQSKLQKKPKRRNLTILIGLKECKPSSFLKNLDFSD